MTTHNALIGHNQPPRFKHFSTSDVVPTIRRLIAEQDAGLLELEKNCQPTWEFLVLRLNAIAEPLSYAWHTVHHLLGVRNEPALREAEEEVQGEVIAAGLRIAASRPIYKGMRTMRDGAIWATLDSVQQRIIDSAIRSAEQAGVGLEGAARERFLEIETALGEMGSLFSNHLLDATKAFELILTEASETEGLPPSLLAAAAQSARTTNSEGREPTLAARLKDATPEKGPWRLTLDGPILMPFLEHSTRSDLREKLYHAQITRATDGELDNQPVIDQILKLRLEKATLLGFADYAALSLSRKMAGTVDAAQHLLDDLRKSSRPAAEREHSDLLAYARSTTQNPILDLKNWDVGYWAEQLRKHRFDFDDEALRPYFSLETVLEGLYSVAERLFGVRVVAAPEAFETWHPDVRTFRIVDAQDQPVAAFFLDPFARPENKRGGAWMDTCLDRKRDPDGAVRLPIAYLVCNQSPPVDGKPSLMTFDEVETLFHEFGHGLQHMLTRVDYVDAAGINNIEWDAVELPSQFMENWCYHRATLQGFARHHETGEPLPADLFEKILAARTYRAGSQFLRQIYFATLDLALHHGFIPGGQESPDDVKRKIARDNTVMAPLPEDRFLAGFSHIFAGGYAAGYYSYKWAEVLAADAFAAFEEVGLDHLDRLAEVGRRFRDTVLSMGGGQHPSEVFKAFRGRAPDPSALLRSYGLAD